MIQRIPTMVCLNPLPSHEGRRKYLSCFPTVWCLNPLPSHEGRPLCPIPWLRNWMFKSTPFSRRETSIHGLAYEYIYTFKSTPFSRRETFLLLSTFILCSCLNPLPSHEGRLLRFLFLTVLGCLNPLPSHEGRLRGPLSDISYFLFKSTPFSRRETPFNPVSQVLIEV